MTTNEAALKLARSIAEREAPAVLECLFGKAYSGTVERVLADGLRVAALAAILEVTERGAGLAEKYSSHRRAAKENALQRKARQEARDHESMAIEGVHIATALRQLEHLS